LSVQVQDADLLVCNQTCFVDWLYLIFRYSPTFTQIVIVKQPGGSTKAGLRILSGWELFKHAIGLKFPEEVSEDPGYVYYSIKQLRQDSGFLWYKGLRPVVVFPEGTKTNGLGILNIEPGIVKMISEAGGLEGNMRITSIRFDHTFQYYPAYNSTDESGWGSFVGCVC